MPVRILHLTDLHLHAHADYELMGYNTRRSLQQVITHAMENWQPELVLATGDLTHDETAEGYQALRPVLESIGLPVYVLPGNHDVPTLMQQELDGEQINSCQHIELQHWQILMLDSSVPNSEGGHLAEGQLQLLGKKLQEQPQLHTLVCLHHQPIAMQSRWLDTMQVDNSEALLSILENNTRARGLLWGHVHQQYDEQRQHMTLMATPSTCGQFKPLSDEFAIDEERGPGYRRLQLHDNGTIETEVVWL